MRVKTECGHEYDTAWREGYARFAPFFYCDVCGKAQAFVLDTETGGRYAETRNANEYFAELGWATVPETMEEAIGRERTDSGPEDSNGGS